MRNLFLLLLMIAGFHSGVFCQTPIRSEQMLFDSLSRAVNSGQYDGVNSILVSHRGKTVYERYFGGWIKDSLHDSRSAFKSFTGLLTGIAIDRGYIKNVYQKVYSFFPEYRSFTGKDSLKRNMTIKDLLNMTAGLDCEEFNDGKDCESDMSLSKDWVKFSLEIPLKNAPGTVWAYNSSAPVILGDVISRAAGMSIMEFAKRFLFSPLGITKYRWTVDPAGHGMTAGSFYILPADMLKIGEMVRQQGKWKGKQIVSAEWIKTSMQAPIAISDFSFMKYSRSAVGIPQPTYYGYYWYKERVVTTAYQRDVWFASGNGGQYLFIIPEIELVVVFMQSNYNSWKAKKAFDLLARYILPGFV
ncbi:MAG: serine hydrolase, partial [Chitinophagaceae bacterium]|nr:serine hydrolase [Chitinophagaceae bacterium]